MEHIIQFGVNIDDDAIQKKVIEQAATAVSREVKKAIGINDNWYPDAKVRTIVSSEINRLFDSLKEEIIAETAKQLTDKLIRSKKVRDMTHGVLEKVFDEV